VSRPPDLRHRDPDVRKERIKLLANGLNATGVALIIGSTVAPIVDSTKHTDFGHVVLRVGSGALLVLAALGLLRYILFSSEVTMDPVYETLLIGAATIVVVGGFSAWLMPKFDRAAGRLSDWIKFDRAAGRLSDWMEDRKDRRAAR